MKQKTICVFISGGGSNLAAIIAAIVRGEIRAKINVVIADRDCLGLAHAERVGIPTVIIPRGETYFSRDLVAAVPPETDLIVLAGFLSIIPPELIAKYPQKIINLHPSLLPKFGGAGMYGGKVHQAVLEAGETESGCTVHYVDTGIDTGEIIAQSKVPVLSHDDAETLQQRVQQAEKPLLIKTLASLLQEFTPSPVLQVLRQKIDQLDQQLAELLCQRLQLIHQAAAEKPLARDIRLADRIEDILQKVLPVAEKYNIDPDYLDLIFRLLIDESIRREARLWHNNQITGEKV